MKYLVTYQVDYSVTEHYSIFDAPANSSWRDLQKVFDPRCVYNYLKFYQLGNEIKRIDNE